MHWIDANAEANAELKMIYDVIKSYGIYGVCSVGIYKYICGV